MFRSVLVTPPPLVAGTRAPSADRKALRGHHRKPGLFDCLSASAAVRTGTTLVHGTATSTLWQGARPLSGSARLSDLVWNRCRYEPLPPKAMLR